MNDKQNIGVYIFVAVLVAVLAVFTWRFVRLEKQLNNVPEPITITDTIVDWQHDTVYRYDTKVVKLPIHDTTTLTDSLWMVDSVLVEVPIYKYYYDTTLADTNRTIRLQATLSGYEVSIDTLALTTTVTPIIIKEEIPWHKRFRPSVGVGVGSNLKGEATVGMYVGIGYLF